MNDLVTIGVPVYNADKYLSICLESIVNQSYPNFELIIVDDGSTDSSRSIIDFYASKDNRIKTIFKGNEGPGIARTLIIDKAEGKYTTFVDSDDYIADNYIEYLLQIINLEKADMVAASEKRFKNKTVLGKKQVTEKLKIYEGDEIIKHSLNYKDDRIIKDINNDFFSTWVVTWGKLYNSELLKKSKVKSNSFNESGEDNTLFLSLLKNYQKIVISNQKLYFCRNVENSREEASFEKKHITNLFCENYFEPFRDFSEWCVTVNSQLVPYADLLLVLSMRMVYQQGVNRKVKFDINFAFFVKYLKRKAVSNIIPFLKMEETNNKAILSLLIYILLPTWLIKSVRK